MADESRIGAGRSTRSLGWAIVLFLVLPITIVVPVSLTDQRFLSLPQDGLSLRHYLNLFRAPSGCPRSSRASSSRWARW